jgi:DNA-binding transcriptional LysR family regulator
MADDVWRCRPNHHILNEHNSYELNSQMTRITMERSGEMEVFLHVVQEGSFSAAARVLDLTPSAVSKLVIRLERRLGARLFVRTTRTLGLTPEGALFHQAASRLLQELDRAERSIAPPLVAGPLRISASIPFGSLYIAPLIPGFLARYPAVTVDLSLTDDMVDLLRHPVDVAIRTGDLPDSGLTARRLRMGPRLVVAAPAYLARRGHPAHPDDLAGHNCLTLNFRRPRTYWPFREGERDYTLAVDGDFQTNNGETLRQMAVVGLGIARLGGFHVADDLAAGRLIEVLAGFNPGDQEPVSALFVGGAGMPHRVRAFVDYAVEYLPA